MKFRVFPNTDVRVSEIGLGTWTTSTGWWGDTSDAEAVAMMRAALDEHGVTFFDAADAYGNGRAERQVAEFAAASELPDLSADDLRSIAELDAVNFGITEDAMKYKGAMTRAEGANTDLQDARNPISRPALPAHTAG